MNNSRSWRSAGQGAGLAIVTAMVLWLGLEGVTRLVGIHFPAIAKGDEAGSDRSLWVLDRKKGWFHAPNARGRSDLGGPDAGLVRINSLGLRGPEIPLAKPQGTKRVLVLGDSFAFGVGVDEAHVFSSRLAELLKRGSIRWEVINMGVSGYATDQELVLFQDLGIALQPDFVMLLGTDNDFEGNTIDFAYRRYYKPYFVINAEGKPSLRGVPVPTLGPRQRVWLWLGQNSNVWNAVRSRRSDVRLMASVLSFFEVATPGKSGESPLEITTALVAELDDLSKRVGARFVMLNTAHRGEETTLFQALRSRLRGRGVAFLGLEETFARARAQAPSRHWDFGSDAHWNVAAHELAAQVGYELVVRSGALASESAE